MHRLPLFFGPFTTVVLLFAGAARAQEGGPSGLEPASPAVPPLDFSLTAGAGILAGPDTSGLYAEVAAAHRMGLLELGAYSQSGIALVGGSFLGLGATAGVRWRAPAGLRLSLAGAVGGHAYKGFGSKFLDDDPGADGNTLFVGARAGASWLFERGPVHFELGPAVAAEVDVTRPRVAYNYHDVESNRDMERTVGTIQVALWLRLGMTYDLP